MEAPILHDVTTLHGDPGHAHRTPILAVLEHTEGWQDRRSLRSYILAHDLDYHVAANLDKILADGIDVLMAAIFVIIF